MRSISTLRKLLGQPISNYQVARPTRLTLINSMLQIYVKSLKSNLNEKFFEKEALYIEFVCKKLSVSPVQAVFLSFFMETGRIKLQELHLLLEIHYSHILTLVNELDDLCKRKFIRISDKEKYEYIINGQAKKAIINDEIFIPTDYANGSLESFLELLQNIFQNNYIFEDANNEVKLFMENNPQLNFVQELKKANLSDEEQLIFLYFCYKRPYIRTGAVVNSVFVSNMKALILLKDLKSSSLIKKGLIKEAKEMTHRSEFRLKKSTIKRFFV